MKTFVYVDGFNLYYGALKRTPYRWLNIKELISSHLLPAKYSVAKIKYLTARVSGKSDPDGPKRQQIYINALKSIDEVEIHFGSFLSKSIWRPTVNLPVADKDILAVNTIKLPAAEYDVVDVNKNRQVLTVGHYPQPGKKRRGAVPHPHNDAIKTEVHSMEEKGSDVNLAAHLLNDAWKELYDAAVVISNDTDLVTPIRMVTTERKKEVFVVAPGRFGMAKPLQNVATYQRHIRTPMLAASQFADPIPNTTIRKPNSW